MGPIRLNRETLFRNTVVVFRLNERLHRIKRSITLATPIITLMAHLKETLNTMDLLSKNNLTPVTPEVFKKARKSNVAQLIDDQLVLMPTPGHMAGSMVAVLGSQRQVLFSGEHLWQNPNLQQVMASKRYCWWNWEQQVQSVQRLLRAGIQPSLSRPGAPA